MKKTGDPAIEDLSNSYPWRSGYARIVIPMSDEGSQDGDGWNTSDETAIESAAIAAEENDVIVLPVLCSGHENKPNMMTYAQEIALATHGKVFTSENAAADLVDGIIDIVTDAVGETKLTGVVPECYVEDAWESPESTNIYELPGDIIRLVCKAKNKTKDDIIAKLSFEYPPDLTQ